MKSIILISIVLNCLTIFGQSASSDSTKDDLQLSKPTVVICFLVRNKAYTLPHFLSYLGALNYPKDRIKLWIRADNNDDNSIEIVDEWINGVSKFYSQINYTNDVVDAEFANRTTNMKSANRTIWTDERFYHVIKLKEEALNYARSVWADYIFFLDTDVFLTYSNTLKDLTEMGLPIVAPMLISESLYSNFWGGISNEYYYQRTDDYTKILHYENVGTFKVPMVHSAVLINLKYENNNYLTFDKDVLSKTFDYGGPLDDIIVFAFSAYHAASPMYISNVFVYGYIMIPMIETDELSRDLQQLTNVNIFILNKYEELYVEEDMKKFVVYPEKDKMSLSEIYMINLKRRPERRKKMETSFDILGLDVEYFEAVDGNTLTDDILKEKDIKMFTGYVDPYTKRPMTMGEIGCFLSHYNIWEEMVAKNLSEVLIIEDDVLFEPYFKSSGETVLKEARESGAAWDIIYFGRKRLEDEKDAVPGTNYLLKVAYSYWTIGYVISLEGAKKLIEGEPLKRLLPVDEYLPIMFDQHPNDTLKKSFENRNLIAWSASPLILFPTHYTGEDGYISDTEDSTVIVNDDFVQTDFDENTSAEKKGDKEVFNESVLMDVGNISENLVVEANSGHFEL